MQVGTSTASTAAVMGIFMGGLGLGGWFFGKRSQSWKNPLRVYGWLELGIAAFAALTPLLLLAAQWIYAQTGGTAALGLPLGTVLRLRSFPCFVTWGFQA